jgi:3alpha(or 20beta)-hydroxysteroid dehydrogenase
MGRLDGRVAIVTGGARGTGAAVVRRFVDEGAQVLVLDLLDDRGEVLADEVGKAAVYRHADVTDEGDWAEAVDDVLDRWGRLDVLVNNAAILHLCPADRTERADFERILQVNLIGPFLGIKACLPALRADGGGSIVNVGSIDSISGTPTTVAYTSSKFALRGLTKVVALEEGKHNVRCNIVCPGGGNSEMITEFFETHPEMLRDDVGSSGRPAEAPTLGRRASLDELAGAIFYFASDDSSFCNGTELVIDGGLHAGQYVDVPGMFRAG